MSELVTTQTPAVGLLAELEKVGGIATTSGLLLPPGLSYDQYESIGSMLGYAEDMINWYIGDWLNYGETEYDSDIYVQAATLTGKSERTLINVKSIAHRIPPQRRRLAVKFSTHGEVASLPPNDQRRILKLAEQDRLSKMQVRDLVREAQGLTNGSVSVLEQERCETCGRPLP